MTLKIEVGTSALGGEGFNVYLCIHDDGHYSEFPLLEKNDTFDNAKRKAFEFRAAAGNVAIPVYHRFGKDGLALISFSS